MYLLPSQQYTLLQPRLGGIPFNTYFAAAVLRGHVGGQVWVDRLDAPAACLIAHPCGLSLLCGETEDLGFLAWLVDYFTRAEYRHRAEFVQAHPGSWARRIPRLLEGRLIRHDALIHAAPGAGDLQAAGRTSVVQCARRNYRFDPAVFAARWEPALPPDFTVESVGARFFSRWGRTVGPAEFWDSENDFRARGMAYAVLHAGEPVSMAFSAFVIDAVREIGIETLPEHRGRGLAAQACRAFIASCLAQGLEPVWACRQGNVGSERTALRVGFVPTRELPYYALVAPGRLPILADPTPDTAAAAPDR